MIEDQTPGQAGGNPEERAFGGKPDMPPGAPDQPEAGNEELLRKDDGAESQEPAKKDPHGDYGNLPGYGG